MTEHACRRCKRDRRLWTPGAATVIDGLAAQAKKLVDEVMMVPMGELMGTSERTIELSKDQGAHLVRFIVEAGCLAEYIVAENDGLCRRCYGEVASENRPSHGQEKP